MAVYVGLHENLKTVQWLEYAAIMTKIKNIRVNPHEDKCLYEKFYGQTVDYTKN